MMLMLKLLVLIKAIRMHSRLSIPEPPLLSRLGRGGAPFSRLGGAAETENKVSSSNVEQELKQQDCREKKDKSVNNISYDRRMLLAQRNQKQKRELNQEQTPKLMQYNDLRTEYKCSLCSNVLTSFKCLPINYKNHKEFIDNKATRRRIEETIEKENLRPYKGTKTVIICKQCRCVNLRRSFNKWNRTLKY